MYLHYCRQVWFGGQFFRDYYQTSVRLFELKEEEYIRKLHENMQKSVLQLPDMKAGVQAFKSTNYEAQASFFVGP